MSSLFHPETTNASSEDHPRCKHCNQRLWYNKCGHSIPLHPVRIAGSKVQSPKGKKLPLITSATKMPENCEACTVAALPSHRRLKVLQSNHEHFLCHYTQRTLTQEQADQVAKDLVYYEAEMNRVRECAEVEFRDHMATR